MSARGLIGYAQAGRFCLAYLDVVMLHYARAAVLALVTVTVPASAAQPADAPEQLLRELYAAHRPWADAPLDLSDPAVVARWFCPGMQRAFAHHDSVVAACPEGESCGLDFDPILSAQDYGDGADLGLRIALLPPPSQQMYAARFRLFGPEGEETELHYRLAQADRHWCIEDIVVPGPDGMALRQYLESL